MAVVAQGLIKNSLELVRTSKSEDSITQKYLTRLDADVSDPVSVYNQMQVATPGPGIQAIPIEGQSYGVLAPHLFAKTFKVKLAEGNIDNLKLWQLNVGWDIADAGETGQQSSNPLARPPKFNIEYLEVEYIITEAENLVDLPHGTNSGGSRPAGTVGTIVHAAGRAFDTPFVDTERNAVLTIERNYGTLAALVSVNEAYQRTTNSDTAVGFPPETLKYLVTDSLGQREENGILYYPGVTRIEKKKTTQLLADNRGYAHWDPDAGEGDPPSGAITDKIKEKGEEGNEIKVEPREPLDLAFDGTITDSPTAIPYRYLTRVPYSTLVS